MVRSWAIYRDDISSQLFSGENPTWLRLAVPSARFSRIWRNPFPMINRRSSRRSCGRPRACPSSCITCAKAILEQIRSGADWGDAHVCRPGIGVRSKNICRCSETLRRQIFVAQDVRCVDSHPAFRPIPRPTRNYSRPQEFGRSVIVSFRKYNKHIFLSVSQRLVNFRDNSPPLLVRVVLRGIVVKRGGPLATDQMHARYGSIHLRIALRPS